MGKIPLEETMASLGQRILEGYGPLGHKESDMTRS